MEADAARAQRTCRKGGHRQAAQTGGRLPGHTTERHAYFRTGKDPAQGAEST